MKLGVRCQDASQLWTWRMSNGSELVVVAMHLSGMRTMAKFFWSQWFIKSMRFSVVLPSGRSMGQVVNSFKSSYLSEEVSS